MTNRRGWFTAAALVILLTGGIALATFAVEYNSGSGDPSSPLEPRERQIPAQESKSSEGPEDGEPDTALRTDVAAFDRGGLHSDDPGLQHLMYSLANPSDSLLQVAMGIDGKLKTRDINPEGIKLSWEQRSALMRELANTSEALAAAMECAQFEHLASLKRSLEIGDYTTGKAPIDLAPHIMELQRGGKSGTVSALPGETQDIQRMVILTPNNAPRYFSAASEVKHLEGERDTTLRAFLARVSSASNDATDTTRRQVR